MRLGVFVSGNLGYNVLNHLHDKYMVKFVFTDSKSKSIIDFCNTNNIDLFVGNPRNEESNKFYQSKPIEVLISVNYLFLIEKKLISHPSILAFNLHGSLLPKYRGRTPHVWAIINNETKTGITAHVIDEGCDSGDIIEQFEIEINRKDTGNDILNKYNKQYIPIIDSVLFKIENKTITTQIQNHSHATYFGKRTPEDGEINWVWQKERIYNWVRAQAFPYPGSFTHYNNYKIIIDEIEFSNFGYDNNMPNGLILSVSPLLVKTTNGVIKINKIRVVDLELRAGGIFQ